MGRQIEIPKMVQPLLDWWLDKINACLGDGIVSVVLYGSITYGDFCPRWSDVDIVVVTDTPVTENECVALRGIGSAMHKRYIKGGESGWVSGQTVEVDYITRELVGDVECRSERDAARGTAHRHVCEHPIDAFSRYTIAKYGQTIAGVELVFASPRTECLIAQTERDLLEIREIPGDSQSGIWLADTIGLLARSLVFWRDGEAISKSAALMREIEAGSAHAKAFKLALRIRREGSMAAIGYKDCLVPVWEEMALTAAGEIVIEMRKGPK